MTTAQQDTFKVDIQIRDFSTHFVVKIEREINSAEYLLDHPDQSSLKQNICFLMIPEIIIIVSRSA